MCVYKNRVEYFVKNYGVSPGEALKCAILETRIDSVDKSIMSLEKQVYSLIGRLDNIEDAILDD